MRTMTYLSIVCGLLLMLPATSWSYEFECGYRISGFSGNGCPYGEVDSPGGCPCSNGNGDLAPKWVTGRLDMKVEAQGGNGVSSSLFTSLGAEAAAMWSEVSGSSLLFSASQTVRRLGVRVTASRSCIGCPITASGSTQPDRVRVVRSVSLSL